MRAFLATILLSVFAVAGPHRTARTLPEGSGDPVLRLIRMVGTTEAEFSASEGGYVSLAALLKHRNFRGYASKLELIDSTSAKTGGYILSVIPSADGKRFQVSLVPEQGCGVAYFSSENYLIYQGKGLGCPER